MNENQTTDTTQCDERRVSVKPNLVVDAITEEQCQNIKDNRGIYGTAYANCDDLTGELLCDIRQVLEYVLNMGVGNVFANEESKCNEDDSPTLASMWSRIYRFAQAVTCILCAYDPFMSAVLKSGKYPQVLTGSAQAGGYPTWTTPDDYPTLGSVKPVTSEGVAKAVQDAVLSVWHFWEEEPSFDFFAQTANADNDPHSLEQQMNKVTPKAGNTALVASSSECSNGTAIYTYDGGWKFKECVKLNDKHNLKNFAVTNIKNGYYKDKEVYYFDGTWQVMDIDLGELEKRVETLEEIYSSAVTSADETKYLLMTKPTLTEAQAVPCSSEGTTIVLIAG